MPSSKATFDQRLMVHCSIPFSVDEISKSMEQIEISDIEPPPLMGENSGFSFLLPRIVE